LRQKQDYVVPRTYRRLADSPFSVAGPCVEWFISSSNITAGLVTKII